MPETPVRRPADPVHPRSRGRRRDPDRLRHVAQRALCHDRGPPSDRRRPRGQGPQRARRGARPSRPARLRRRCLRCRGGGDGSTAAGRCRCPVRGRPSLLALLADGSAGLRSGRGADDDDHREPPPADRGRPAQRLQADRPRRCPGPARRRSSGRPVPPRQDRDPARRQHLRCGPRGRGATRPAPAGRGGGAACSLPAGAGRLLDRRRAASCGRHRRGLYRRLRAGCSTDRARTQGARRQAPTGGWTRAGHGRVLGARRCRGCGHGLHRPDRCGAGGQPGAARAPRPGSRMASDQPRHLCRGRGLGAGGGAGRHPRSCQRSPKRCTAPGSRASLAGSRSTPRAT